MNIPPRGRLSRRSMLAGCGAAMGAGQTVLAASPPPVADAPPFRFCLNMATLRGYKLPVPRQVEVAAAAGYSGIEPWIGDLQQYAAGGGSLDDLRKQIADAGLTVESAIGFTPWLIDDDAQRRQGMEQFQRDMELLARIGGRRIAAAPAGAYATAGIDLRKIGERYRALLELGRRVGVVPQLEIWGGSKTLGRVADAAFVAVEAGHPDACLLLDIFHMYKGGSEFASLRLFSGAAMHVLHVNDYPADPPREKITDADRVFPGDGVAPIATILRDLRTGGFRGALSLELFNPRYWKQEPLATARTGLAKMQAAVRKGNP